MDFSKYQELAQKTAIYPPGMKVVYPVLGLTNEAGEVAGKLKKVFRDKGGIMDTPSKDALEAELGDVLWYIAAIATDLGLELDTIAAKNIAKLYSRMEREKISGDGDER